jgi:hypothetical protein
MQRLLFAALACLVAIGLSLSSAVDAQVLDTQFISAAGSTCSPTTSACAIFQPGSASSISITTTGTFSATLTLEATTDGINWVTVQGTNVADGSASTIPANGITIALANVGYLQVRVRASAYVSGTVRVSATRGFALSARVGGGGSGSGGYTNVIQVDPNTIALRNGTTAQEFDIFKSYTDANNFQRLRFFWDTSLASPTWNIFDEKLVSGSPDASNTGIRLTGKSVTFLADNNSSIRLDGTGINMVNTQINYNTLDASLRITGSRASRAKECWAAAGANGNAAVGLCVAQIETSVLGFFATSAATETTGGSATIMIGDAGTKPTCQESRRGMFWHDFGGAGVKDTVEICAKDAADAYAWRTIY